MSPSRVNSYSTFTTQRSSAVRFARYGMTLTAVIPAISSATPADQAASSMRPASLNAVEYRARKKERERAKSAKKKRRHAGRSICLAWKRTSDGRARQKLLEGWNAVAPSQDPTRHQGALESRPTSAPHPD